MDLSDLTYRKYGTRIAAVDETNDGSGIQQFAYDGTRAMRADSEWEILPGPVERMPDGTGEGEEVFAYLWPIARWTPRCQEPTCPDFGDPSFGEGTCPSEHASPAKEA